jgi:hypothetical protein
MLLRFNDFAAAQARGADADAFGRGAYLGVDRAQVDVPAPFGHVVSVTDIVPELRPFAADITDMCHGLLQIRSELDSQNTYFNGISGL